MNNAKTFTRRDYWSYTVASFMISFLSVSLVRPAPLLAFIIFLMLFFFIQLKRLDALGLPNKLVILSLIPFINIFWFIALGYMEKDTKLHLYFKNLLNHQKYITIPKNYESKPMQTDNHQLPVDSDNIKYNLYIKNSIKSPKVTLILTLLIGPLGYIYLSFRFAALWVLAVSSITIISFLIMDPNSAVNTFIIIWLLNAIGSVYYSKAATNNYNQKVKDQAYLLHG